MQCLQSGSSRGERGGRSSPAAGDQQLGCAQVVFVCVRVHATGCLSLPLLVFSTRGRPEDSNNANHPRHCPSGVRGAGAHKTSGSTRGQRVQLPCQALTRRSGTGWWSPLHEAGPRDLI